MLSPYLGSRIAEHFGTTKGPHSRKTYGDDQTGTVTYNFNSLGFRSEEFRSDALKRIYVCGASDTFGTGLEMEDTWPYQLALHFARHNKLNKGDVCLMNFSEGGCSNRYICRTLLQQCSLAKPDLVVAHFTFLSRQETLVPHALLPEVFSGGENWGEVSFTSWGRWTDVGLAKCEIALMKIPRAKRPWARKIARRARAFYRNYDPLAVIYDTLQQILLLQFFLHANRIEFVFCMNDVEQLENQEARRNCAVSALYDMLDRSRFLKISMSDDEFWINLAADGNHQGIMSNKKFADSLWSECACILS